MYRLKYYELIQELREMRKRGGAPVLKISLLSNIIVHQLVEILDYWLRQHRVICNIRLGNYDNIIQDAASIPKDEIVIIFWESANIVDGFHYKVKTLEENEVVDFQSKLQDELAMVFDSLKEHKQVFLNTFHCQPFEYSITSSAYTQFVDNLNTWTRQNLPENFALVNIDAVFFKLGIDSAFNLRKYYSSKVLYSIEFYKYYSEAITPMMTTLAGKIKKVLILDGDNTLWGGILGEDGMDGIKISTPFKIVQASIVSLYKNGILICLCSKNNPDEVDDLLYSNAEMILRDEHIIIKKVNWENKVSNIIEIGEELNLGMDSFIFVDDSDFEVNLVRKELPEVMVYQVPQKTVDYPQLMEEVVHQFINNEKDSDDNKTIQYRAQRMRTEAKKSFASIEEYLRSLDIKIKISKNKVEHIPRLAQLTQKTNQFNLTTRRYTEQDLKRMLRSGDHALYALTVADKYGESGITGLAILRYFDDDVEIDSLLLSCRILGRNIEWVFIDELISQVNMPLIKAQYKPTYKNNQVRDFYDRSGFKLISESDSKKTYVLDRSSYVRKNTIDYIQMEYD